jgi:hypothetical protein
VNNYREELQRAIKATHGADAVYVRAVPVKEVFRGEPAWEGQVEVFALTNHPKALLCFAWGARRLDNKGWDVTAVLGVPPVLSPQDAVKAAIVAYAKQTKP